MNEYKNIVNKISTPADKKTKQKDYLKDGKFPIVDQGQELIGGYSDDESNVLDCTLPVIVFGDHTKCVKYIDFPFCPGADGIKVLQPKEGILPKYLFYLTMYLTYKIEDKGYARHYQYIEKKIVDIPSLGEQATIVEKIEELFSQIDTGIETLGKIKTQLNTYKQALLKTVFEDGTEEHRLEELCEFITKGTTPKKDKMNNDGAGIPFIKVYNLTFDSSLDFSIDPTFVDEGTHKGFLTRSVVYPGDVLMNIVGPPMGKVSIVPDTYPEWNINQAIARFRCHNELNNKYLAYYLNYAKTVENMMKKSKATAGQFNLTLEICRDITIPLPKLEEQNRIVKRLDEELSVCKQIENTVANALAQAEALRQSVLKKAFEGRLV